MISRTHRQFLGWVLTFNYEITNLPNYPIPGEKKDAGANNKNKIIVTTRITV